MTNERANLTSIPFADHLFVFDPITAVTLYRLPNVRFHLIFSRTQTSPSDKK